MPPLTSTAAAGPFASWGHADLRTADLHAGETQRRARRWAEMGKSVRSIGTALRLSDSAVRCLLASDEGPSAA